MVKVATLDNPTRFPLDRLYSLTLGRITSPFTNHTMQKYKLDVLPHKPMHEPTAEKLQITRFHTNNSDTRQSIFFFAADLWVLYTTNISYSLSSTHTNYSLG